MTDSRLQQLERAWEASGSPEDEAAYLRERVRVGELSRERLELAAYCRHEGAEVVLGSPTQAQLSLAYSEYLEESGDSFAAWFQGVSSWGRVVAFQASSLCLGLVLTESVLAHPVAARLYPKFLEWWAEPDDRLGAECLALARSLFAELEGPDPVNPVQEAGLWALATATEFVFSKGEIWRGTPQVVAQHASCGAVDVGGDEDPDEYVLRVVQAELGLWALGGSGP